MTAFFSAGTGLLVFLWARSLFGLAGALISLAFYVFSPEALSHASSGTREGIFAFWLLAAVTVWWRHLHRRVWGWALVSVTTFSLACLLQPLRILLLPMFVLIAAARLRYGSRKDQRWTEAGRMALSFTAHLAAAVVLLWVCNGLRDAGTFSDCARNGWVFPAVDNMASVPVAGVGLAPAPAPGATSALLYGIGAVIERCLSISGDLFSRTTLGAIMGVWLLLTFKLGMPRDKWSLPRQYVLAPLLALVLVYGGWLFYAGALGSHQYLLPIYLVFYIGLGALRLLWEKCSYFGKVMVLASLALHCGGSLGDSPDYRDFHNSLVGTGRFSPASLHE